MLGRSSVLRRDFGMCSKTTWDRGSESLGCPKSWTNIYYHTFVTGHMSTPSSRVTAPPTLNNSCVPAIANAADRQQRMFLFHFYLIWTALSIFRNFLLCICGFVIISGTANLAGSPRSNYSFLIHCFILTYFYIWTKTRDNKKYGRFYSSLTQTGA